jgi:NAD(P)-dependent dehydrogenase (short-subunit alcohol dehydrogenase family)
MRANELTLSGKVALVTGAARNLPAVIAQELAAAGAAVAVHDRFLDEDLCEVARAIARTGSRELAVEGDVCSQDQMRAMVARVQGELGTINILVNGVGPFAGGPFLELSEGDWDRVMDANLKAVYLLTQLVAPAMKKVGWGRIINFSAGSADYRSASVYGLAKNALRYLTECLAVELGPSITVNAISPGQIIESAPDVAVYDSTLVARATQHTPTGRLVSRQEVAQMVVLLCSSAFDSITGQTIRMDGGWSIPHWLSTGEGPGRSRSDRNGRH